MQLETAADVKRRQEKISLSTNANHTKLRFIRISKGKRRVSAGTAAADGKAAVVHSPEDSGVRSVGSLVEGDGRSVESQRLRALMMPLMTRDDDNNTEETMESAVWERGCAR